MDAQMGASLVDRKLPPVTEVGAASMIAVAVGLIYNAAYLPKHAQTGVAIAILAVAAALQLVNAFLLSRIQNFAWDRFKQVAGWSLLAYAIIAGMIEYVFIYDDTRGTQLAILTLLLTLFMVNVPVLIGFTVARYERV
jgi:type III secretory pathway component EscS